MNGLPAILEQRSLEDRCEIELLIDADNPWFAGHFPGQPILPGVVQIGWAVHFASSLRGFDPVVHGIEQIKFKRPILPGARLVLRLTPGTDGYKVRYEYRDAENSYSSGILNFGNRS